MKMCINKKVVVGLAAVAGGILLFAPRAFGAALPLLFLLVCPLSMVLMMRGMAGGRSCGASDSAPTSAEGISASATPAGDDAELIRLRAEVDQLHAEIRDRDEPVRKAGEDHRA